MTHANIAGLVRLRFIVERKGQMTRQGRAAWACYSRRRKRAGLDQLTVPAILQERWKRSQWPYDKRGELLSETLGRAPGIITEGELTA